MSDGTIVDVGAGAGEAAPEVKIEVEPGKPEADEVVYMRNARAVLTKLDNTPMGNHETRLLKEALLTLFKPALEQAQKLSEPDKG